MNPAKIDQLFKNEFNRVKVRNNLYTNISCANRFIYLIFYVQIVCFHINISCADMLLIY